MLGRVRGISLVSVGPVLHASQGRGCSRRTLSKERNSYALKVFALIVRWTPMLSPTAPKRVTEPGSTRKVNLPKANQFDVISQKMVRLLRCSPQTAGRSHSARSQRSTRQRPSRTDVVAPILATAARPEETPKRPGVVKHSASPPPTAISRSTRSSKPLLDRLSIHQTSL
jgi:hypothetical protein